MPDFYVPLGWCFSAIALLFLLGLLRPFARRFYPRGASVWGRAAAPVLFSLLAFACFAGAGLPALALAATLGLFQIRKNRARAVQRETRQRQTHFGS